MVAASPEILRLGSNNGVELPLKEQVLQGLRAGQSPKYVTEPAYQHRRSLPTVLLYDDKLYDDITKTREYYPFQAELDLLTKHGDEIARAMFGSQHGRKDANGQADGQPLKDEQNYDPLTNQVKKDSSKWGDFETGKHNYGVNGHTAHKDTSNSSGVVIELGAGALTKTKVLLRALSGLLDQPGSSIDDLSYWAVDLEHGQLVSTLRTLADNEHDAVDTRPAPGKIHARGVCASYEEVLPILGNGGLHGNVEVNGNGQLNGLVNGSTNGTVESNNVEHHHAEHKRQSILWLGSSIGNFDRAGGSAFLKRIADEALKPGDTILLGIDGCDDKAKIELAYNDPAGATRDFILNGVQRAATDALGTDAFSAEDFEYLSRYNTDLGAHEAFIKTKRAIQLPASLTGGEAIHLDAGEVVAIEQSFKYNQAERDELFHLAGLRVVGQWQTPEGYALVVLERPSIRFDSTLTLPRPFGLPTLEEWQTLWRTFDAITLEMVTKDLLHTKPIDLRHICLFYIGHIPAFLDIHLSRFLKEPYTEPSHYPEIFERGIDPNVDDPSQIHSHSEVPEKEEDWPTLGEILAYRDRVRARLTKVYNEKALVAPSRRLARTLSMVFEHEALHAETLCYMLAQVSERIRATPGFALPQWNDLKGQWNAQVARDGQEARAQTIDFAASTLVLGQDDDDQLDDSTAYDESHSYGWDNETPSRPVEVPAFKISVLPISNADYLGFLDKQSGSAREALVPSSWVANLGGSFDVRVLPPPGRVAFDVAQHWPVQASSEQLEAYAHSKGARLPTESELRRFYLENPVDAPGRNVGLQNLHPVPPTLPTLKRDGTSSGASNGGVWEWTASDFDAHDGFKPSALYPLYSVDFFDGHHAKVIGGSYMTIPRIAGRRSFCNFYQRKYPYVFAGGRLAWPAS